MDSPSMGIVKYDVHLGVADASGRPPARLEVPGHGGARFQHPGTYQPWTHDGRALLLALHGGGTVLFDVASGECKPLPSRTRPRELGVASCSPRAPFAFVAPDGGNTGSFFDLGPRLRPLSSLALPLDWSFYSWDQKGRLLALVQDPARASAELRVYDPPGPEPLEALELSARVLLPFDEDACAEITNLDALAVPSTAPQVTGVRLGQARKRLDLWHDARFTADRLYLCVYRPAGATRKPWFARHRAAAVVAQLLSGQGWVCPAEPRWVEVRLDSGSSA